MYENRVRHVSDEHPNTQAANAIRRQLLTGARDLARFSASRKDDFDLQRGVWTKPSHQTKQKRTEHIFDRVLKGSEPDERGPLWGTTLRRRSHRTTIQGPNSLVACQLANGRCPAPTCHTLIASGGQCCRVPVSAPQRIPSNDPFPPKAKPRTTMLPGESRHCDRLLNQSSSKTNFSSHARGATWLRRRRAVRSP